MKRLAIVGLLLAASALSGCRFFCPESRNPAYCCPTAQPARVQAAPVCNPPVVCVPCQ
jgi:hypothetical protein